MDKESFLYLYKDDLWSIIRQDILPIISRSHTKQQIKNLISIKFHKTKQGYIVVKHLPDSSKLHYRNGSWKDYWVSKKNTLEFPFPKKCDCCFRKPDEMVGCHVIDEKKRVYIYPACKSCNSEVIGRENEFPFYAKKDWLVPFRVEEATCENLNESPSELLNEAIKKISFY